MNANYIVNLYKFVWVLFQFENPISKNVSIAANFTRSRAVNSDQLSQHCECVCVCVFCAFSYILCRKFRRHPQEIMAGRELVRKTVQQVRPILSVDSEEARRRVLSLYKAWYRQIPYIGECSKC